MGQKASTQHAVLERMSEFCLDMACRSAGSLTFDAALESIEKRCTSALLVVLRSGVVSRSGCRMWRSNGIFSWLVKETVSYPTC